MGSRQVHKELKEIVTSPDWQKAVKTYKDKLSLKVIRVIQDTPNLSIAKSRTPSAPMQMMLCMS